MTIEKLAPETANKIFTKILGKQKTVICFYHWKMCSHCFLFKPIWEQIANKYKNDLTMVDIELDAMKHLDKEYIINMFPSIIVYKSGKKYTEYLDKREVSNLDAFMKTFIEKNPKSSTVKKTNKNKK